MAHSKEAVSHATLLFHHLVIGVGMVGNGCVLTTGVLFRRHSGRVAMGMLRLRSVAWHRLCLRGVGGVIYCESRLLPQQKQQDGYPFLCGFVVDLCIHRCKVTTKTNNYAVSAFYLCLFHNVLLSVAHINAFTEGFRLVDSATVEGINLTIAVVFLQL